MRGVFAATAILCVLFIAPAHARSGPDCINVMGVSGFECVSRQQATGVPKTRHFGTYTKAPKSVKAKTKKKESSATKVAGKTFRPSRSVSFHSSAAPWLNEARRHVGTNPTGRRSLWCADFVNLTLKRTGHAGTGSRAAKSFLSHGKRVAPTPGAIAVYHRGKGGHVAIVEKVEGNTVTLVSGNCGRKGVCRYTRSVGSAIAYVWPEA